MNYDRIALKKTVNFHSNLNNSMENSDNKTLTNEKEYKSKLSENQKIVKENIMDIDVCNCHYNILEKQIRTHIERKEKVSIIAINPEKIMFARSNPSIKKILNQATYQIPDGIGILYASKILKKGIKNRITGIDTMGNLCKMAVKYGYRIFLYGSTKDVIENTKRNLKVVYPNINIVGYLDGYTESRNAVIKKINRARPDIVFVALGSPKQEKFIIENMSKINASVFQGVGGSFDVFSGKVKRAPLWCRKIGLEWLYRLIKQPKRLIRQLKLFNFLFLIIITKFQNK